MSAFHFRLETLLRLRIAERDERRADLAKALRAEGLLLGELRQIEVEQLQAKAKVREQSAPGAADVDGLLQTNRYQLVLKSQRGQLENQLAQVRAELERRRLALLEADRGVRVLEKLRERQQAAFRQREERQETKMLDEVAVGTFNRRREAAT